jgi:hypothetical protein
MTKTTNQMSIAQFSRSPSFVMIANVITLGGHVETVNAFVISSGISTKQLC